ncbi:hypothetical protein, partial [Pseudoxanthomonas mexicana]|uniref:hypothetical protein n=1 Tax=Pseudoxanthomonas mexicana TaxID=128785 RepID=UPI0028A6C742
MPSPTSALSFATPASAPATTPANATISNDDGSATKKPAFDDMVRRPARRAGEAKDHAAPRPDRTAGRPEKAAPASTEKDTTEEALAASSVPPILMELPPIQA